MPFSTLQNIKTNWAWRFFVLISSSFDEQELEELEDELEEKVFQQVKLRQPVPGSKIDILKSSIEKQVRV